MLAVLAVATAAAVAATLLAGVQSLVTGTNWRELVIAESLLVLALAAWPAAMRLALRERADWLEPIVAVSVIYVMVFCVRPLFLLSPWADFMLDVPTEVHGAASFDERDMAEVLFYALLGLVCFQLGYGKAAAEMMPLSVVAGPWSSARVTRVAVLGAVLAAVSLMLVWPVIGGLDAVVGELGRLRGLLLGYGYQALGLDLLPVVALVLWVDHLRGRRRWLLVPVVAASNLYNVAIGSRAGVFNLWLFLYLAHRYLAARRARPRRWVAAALVAGVVVVALTVAELRNQGITDWTQAREVAAALWTEKPAAALAATFLLEFNQADIFSVLVHAGSQTFPRLWGGSFLELFLQPIPRSWWPDKPWPYDVEVGYHLTGVRTAIPAGLVGELFLNFHLPGVILGMFLYGAACRAVYRRLLGRPRDPGNVLLYALLFPYLPLLVLRSFVGALTTPLAFLVPAWVAVRYIQRGRATG